MNFLINKESKSKQKARQKRARMRRRIRSAGLGLAVLIIAGYLAMQFMPSAIDEVHSTATPTPSPTIRALLQVPPPTITLTPTHAPTPTENLLMIAAQQERAILDLLNAARKNQNIAHLRIHPQLTIAAAIQSEDMAKGEFLEHEGSDGSSVGDRASRTGYSWMRIGENILYQPHLDAHRAFQLWWDSPPHHKNMMSPDFTEIGIAYAVAADGYHYYTMVLGNAR